MLYAVGSFRKKEYDWKEDTAPQIPYNEMILYKVHVRGYTKQAKLSLEKKVLLQVLWR